MNIVQVTQKDGTEAEYRRVGGAPGGGGRALLLAQLRPRRRPRHVRPGRPSSTRRLPRLLRVGRLPRVDARRLGGSLGMTSLYAGDTFDELQMMQVPRRVAVNAQSFEEVANQERDIYGHMVSRSS